MRARIFPAGTGFCDKNQIYSTYSTTCVDFTVPLLPVLPLVLLTIRSFSIKDSISVDRWFSYGQVCVPWLRIDIFRHYGIMIPNRKEDKLIAFDVGFRRSFAKKVIGYE
jgi:hypothetical protein